MEYLPCNMELLSRIQICLTDLELIRHHVPQTLVVDKSDEYVAWHLLPSQATECEVLWTMRLDGAITCGHNLEGKG